MRWPRKRILLSNTDKYEWGQGRGIPPRTGKRGPPGDLAMGLQP